MKPGPQANFLVTVRARTIDEYDHAARDAFEGIFDVYLNQMTVQISFVPEVDRKAGWPPNPPEDTDAIRTIEEARRSAISLSDYVVMPDDERSGESEAWTASEPNTPSPVVFYVDKDRFARFTSELGGLNETVGMNSLSGGARVSELLQFEVTRKILQIVFSSQFDPELRQRLTPAQPSTWTK